MRRIPNIVLLTVMLASAAVVVACSWVDFFPESAVAPHPLRMQFRNARVGIERIDPADALDRLRRIDPTGDDGLREVARTVAAGIVNHETPAGTVDPAMEPRFLESPPLWIEISVRRWSDPADAATIAMGRLERANWRSGLAVGAGLCSQCSLVVADFLRERGVVAQPTGLGGHVVTRVFTPNGERIVDADLGVLLPFGLEDAERDPEAVRRAYLAAGYDAPYVSRIVDIYGAEGNGPYYGSTVESNDAGRRSRWRAQAALVLASSLVVFAFLGSVRIARQPQAARREVAGHDDAA